MWISYLWHYQVLALTIVATLCTCAASTTKTGSKQLKRAVSSAPWSEWTVSSTCTASCGGGYLVRKRSCNTPPSDSRERLCTGSAQEASTVPCNVQPCPSAGRLTVNLQPSVIKVWQSYSTAFHCISKSEEQTATLEFSINGKDINIMSNVKTMCWTSTNCSLLIHRVTAGKDNGTVSCCMNSQVGKTCTTARLIVQAASFSVSLNHEILVGSRVYPEIVKIPANNPVNNLIVELTVSKTRVIQLNESVPAQGKYEWNVKQLPNGAQFNVLYRLRVWDKQTQSEAFSNTFKFKRNRIHITAPLNGNVQVIMPPIAHMGLTTWYSYNYSKQSVFMTKLTVSLVTLNGTFADNVGTLAVHSHRQPSVASWVPGISRKLQSDVYRLYAKDEGQTGAEGMSEPFRITGGSLHIVVPSHVTYGTVVRVFGKIVPKELSARLYYHIVEADNCNNEVVDVTDEIENWPHATWQLSLSTFYQVKVGQQYRLRAMSLCPSYLHTCSANTITFDAGKLAVSIAKASDVVYLDESYAITFHVPEKLVLVTRVSVNIHCHTMYGVSEKWTIASDVLKEAHTVWWHVGHEGVNQPWHSVSAGHVCHVSVYDANGSGAAGTSQNITVVKSCVIVNSRIRTGFPMEIGVQFRSNQDLSGVSVQLVTQSNISNVLHVYPSSDITVGANMLTVQTARVPTINGIPVADSYVVQVSYPKDDITAFSDPLTFYGWLLQVKIHKKWRYAQTRLFLMSEIVDITFSVPEQFVNLVGSIKYNVYLRNSTNEVVILSAKPDFSLNKYSAGGIITITWAAGETADGSKVSSGHYVVVVKDATHNGVSFLAEGQSQDIEILAEGAIWQQQTSKYESFKEQQSAVNSQSSGNGKLSQGAIAGIVVGVIIIMVVFILLVIVVVKSGRQYCNSTKRQSILNSRQERSHLFYGYQALGATSQQENTNT